MSDARVLSKVGVALAVACAAAVLVLVLLAGPARAQQDPYGGGSPQPSPTRIAREEPPPSVLPFTGADVTLFAATGAVAIATGVLILRHVRARRGD